MTLDIKFLVFFCCFELGNAIHIENVTCQHLKLVPSWFELKEKSVPNIALKCAVETAEVHVNITKLLMKATNKSFEELMQKEITAFDVYLTCPHQTDKLGMFFIFSLSK